jgi:hypothetical protein
LVYPPRTFGLPVPKDCWIVWLSSLLTMTQWRLFQKHVVSTYVSIDDVSTSNVFLYKNKLYICPAVCYFSSLYAVPDLPIGSIGWSLGSQKLGGIQPRCIIKDEV